MALNAFKVIFVSLAHSLNISVAHVVPSTVVVVIENNVVSITVFEEIIPVCRSEMAAIMEDKLEVRRLLTHHVTNIAVEDL